MSPLEEFKESVKPLDITKLMEKSVSETSITLEVIEQSDLCSFKVIQELMTQFGDYSKWVELPIFCGPGIGVYTQGDQRMRIQFQLETDDIKKAGLYFYNLELRSSWDELHFRQLVKKSEYQDISQILYSHSSGKQQYTEYIVIRNIGEGEDSNQLFMVFRSVAFCEDSPVPEIRRIHTPAILCKMELSEEEPHNLNCECIWQSEDPQDILSDFMGLLLVRQDYHSNPLNRILQVK